MIKHPDSHMDHGITEDQWHYVFTQLADRTDMFVETLALPDILGTVANALYGPSAGDPPVDESEVYYATRGSRVGQSRMVHRSLRPTRWIRIIAGPHDGHPCVLYTAYGVATKDMAEAPREPWDPECKDVEASKVFWSAHALAAA